MKSFTPLILIIVAIGLFFFQVSPLYSSVSQLRAESKQYDEAITRAAELKTLRAGLTQTLENLPKAQIERLDHFLPRYLDTVRIILDLDGVAARNGISLKGLTVVDPTQKGGAPAGPAKTAYNTVQVSFNFLAAYDQGQSFILDLQRSLRLFDATSLNVKANAANPAFYDFTMTVETYWIPPPPKPR